MAALLVAIASFAVAPANALTSREAKELKARILSVPVPEMPAKGAELVTSAKKENREATALTVVKAVVFKHKAAAPMVVSAISKVAPDLAPAVSAAAAEISNEQAVTIAQAAAFQAPAHASEISAKVMQAAPAQSRSIAASLPSSGAQPIGAQITSAQTTGAQITSAQTTGAQITGAQITGAQITGAQITSTRGGEAVTTRGQAAAQDPGSTSVSNRPIDYTHTFPPTPPRRPIDPPGLAHFPRHF